MFSVHIDTARTWRGGQSQVLYTVLGLRSLGHRAMLVAHPQGELFRRAREAGDIVPLAPRGEIDLTAAWKLSRLLKQLRPDVVHAHDPHAVSMTATALAIATPQPAPAVVASRRIEFRIGRNALSRWKYSRVDSFIANSGAIRTRLAADGVAQQRIAVVNEGVDVERMVQIPAVNIRTELELPADALLVGNVAALVPHKGQQHLIDAAALVVREVPNARFIVVGDGELRAPLERRIRDKRLDRNVFLVGFRADALALTKGFDVFAMSSISEGMCTALVDAMAASKAAVATTAGGIPEVLVDGETGFLVPPRDAAAMAEKLVVLLKDASLRARMGEAALQRARERFTVQRMVEGTAAVYEQVISAGSHVQAAR